MGVFSKNNNRHNKVVIWIFSIVILSSMIPSWQLFAEPVEELGIPAIYGDGMLFQREKPIIFKGTATPNHKISVKMSNETSIVSEGASTAATDGKWQVTLPGIKGGYDKYKVEIYDDASLSKTINDIVIGELWLSAGQSNMQYTLGWTPDAQQMLKNPTDEFLRFLNTPGIPVGGLAVSYVPFDPMEDIEGANWGKGTDSVKLRQLSAISYYFAARLRNELDMPVGILSVSMGGTSIYAWLSREAIDGNDKVKTYLKKATSYTSTYATKYKWNMVGGANYFQMTAMYNEKVAPLTHLNIKGMIWYQGETNSHEPADSYRDAMNLLLSDYSKRFRFANDEMPLIFSHIATHFYNYAGTRPLETNAIFGEAMSGFWQDHPKNTSQIAIYDVSPEYRYTSLIPNSLGEDPIHPMTKQPVGERMAQAALGMVYTKASEYTSPVYKNSSVSGDSIIIKFDHVGDGLGIKSPVISQYVINPKDIAITGFAIAGSDGIYIPAKAKIISSDTVKVWSDTLSNPISATYAFTEMNMYSNLISTNKKQELFAAVPFRTKVIEGAKFDNPKYWTSCDLPQIWHSKCTKADYFDSWTKGALSNSKITFTYDPKIKTEGTASLKVDFTTDKNKKFAISPKMNENGENTPLFIDTDRNLTGYETLSFDIKNTTGRELQLREMLIKVSDVELYRPIVWETTSITKSLGNSKKWQNVVLDLRRLSKVGADSSQIFTNEKLNKISDIQFVFVDSSKSSGSTGTMYVDNFVFGLTPYKTDAIVYPDSGFSIDFSNESVKLILIGLISLAVSVLFAGGMVFIIKKKRKTI